MEGWYSARILEDEEKDHERGFMHNCMTSVKLPVKPKPSAMI
jgi:hypothetical protein